MLHDSNVFNEFLEKEMPGFSDDYFGNINRYIVQMHNPEDMSDTDKKEAVDSFLKLSRYVHRDWEKETDALFPSDD